MHEFGIADGVVKHALAEAEKHNAKRVSMIKVRVGGKTHITADAMTTCIEAVAKGTIAEDAEIEIEVFSDVYRCSDCASTYPASAEQRKCPKCGSDNVEIFTGEEVYLDSLELED